LVVEHVRCVEHGQWVHPGEHDESRESNELSEASDATSTDLAFGTTPDAEPHEHDHCAPSLDQRVSHDLGRHYAVKLTPPGHPRALAELKPRVPGSFLVVYAFAPKTSPPRVPRLV